MMNKAEHREMTSLLDLAREAIQAAAEYGEAPYLALTPGERQERHRAMQDARAALDYGIRVHFEASHSA